MLAIGVLGINFKTADLTLRDAIARGVECFSGAGAIFFHHAMVVLSTCNRTEIYFSAVDLAEAHSDLLAQLRLHIAEPFEHRLYSYFGTDCFAHLCRVTSGLDSAILAETEIQRQVKVAYAKAKELPPSLHYLFQKALKVGKLIRNEFEAVGPSLCRVLWRQTEWKNRRILLVGYSEINRGLISFLSHKQVKGIALCTRWPTQVNIEGIYIFDRSELSRLQEYDVIVCASKSESYLITGGVRPNQCIFDLSVPRNVDPEVGKVATLYNIDQLIEQRDDKPLLERCEELIWANVIKLARIYRLKTRHALGIVGMELRL